MHQFIKWQYWVNKNFWPGKKNSQVLFLAMIHSDETIEEITLKNDSWILTRS